MVSKETIITASMVILITYTLSLSFVNQAYTAEQSTKTFSNTGTIQTSPGIGVYSNSYCTTELTSLPWGSINPGDSSSITFWVKNEGDTQTVLSFWVDNWSSLAAETYLSVDWDYNNALINPDQTVAITLTLSVNANIQNVETFSFDLTIIGS